MCVLAKPIVIKHTPYTINECTNFLGFVAISYECFSLNTLIFSCTGLQGKKKKKLEEEIKKKQLLHRSVSFPVYRKAWAGLAAHTPRTLSTPVPRELLIEPKE